jgi:hypothetical protein
MDDSWVTNLVFPSGSTATIASTTRSCPRRGQSHSSRGLSEERATPPVSSLKDHRSRRDRSDVQNHPANCPSTGSDGISGNDTPSARFHSLSRPLAAIPPGSNLLFHPTGGVASLTPGYRCCDPFGIMASGGRPVKSQKAGRSVESLFPAMTDRWLRPHSGLCRPPPLRPLLSAPHSSIPRSPPPRWGYPSSDRSSTSSRSPHRSRSGPPALLPGYRSRARS